jgi:hypothetical protein
MISVFKLGINHHHSTHDAMMKFMQKRWTIAPPRIHRPGSTEMRQKSLKYGNEIRDVEIFPVSITERFWFV